MSRLASWSLRAWGLAVGCAYWPWIESDPRGAGWTAIVLGSAIAIWGCGQPWQRWHWWLVAGWGYALASLSWAAAPLDGVQELMQWLGLTVVLLLGAKLPQAGLQAGLNGLAAACGVSLVLVVLQLSGAWQPLVRGAPSAALFVNPNWFGETTAIVHAGKWWLWPLAMAVMGVTGARGAMVGFAVSVYATAGRVRFAFGLLLLALVALVLLWALAPTWPPASSIVLRMQIWGDAVRGLVPFGHGIGSFWHEFPHKALGTYLVERPDHAHNDGVEAAFELGVGMLPAVMLLVLALRGRDAVAKGVLLGILAESVFGFPWHTPATAWAGAFALGRLLACDAELGRGLERGGVDAGWLGDWRGGAS